VRLLSLAGLSGIALSLAMGILVVRFGGGCGFFHKPGGRTNSWRPLLLADYKWRMPGGIEKAWTSQAMEWERTRATVVEETKI